MRLSLASTSALTDARGHNKKARALSALRQQGQRAVVSYWLKPTGARADNTRARLTPTHPSDRTQSKLAFLLSPRSLGRSSNGADNEHSAIRETGPSNQPAHRRLFDSLDWYKSAKFVRTVPNPVSGNVDEDRISTSHVSSRFSRCEGFGCEISV